MSPREATEPTCGSRFARLRTADHRHVARGTREVDDEGVASLIVGPVDHTDRDGEVAGDRGS